MQTTHATGQDTRKRPEPKSEKYSALVWRRFKRNRMALVALWLMAMLVTLAIFASFFSPHNPQERNSKDIYLPPQSLQFSDDNGFSLRPFVHPVIVDFDPVTFQPLYKEDTSQRVYLKFFEQGWEYSILGIDVSTHLFVGENGEGVHLLGTDGWGRDVLSRIFHGTGITLFLAFVVMIICVTIGSFVGIASGYYGGRTDLWVQRVVELMLAFPELPLFLSVIAILPKTSSSESTLILFILLLGGLKWAQLAREIRGKSLALRNVDFVKSAVAVGATDNRIIVHHILPNVMSHVIVRATSMVPQMILIESFLSFLGVGIQPPLVSLGLMLNAAKDFQVLGSYPWLLSPVVFILIAVLVFNAAGDGLRDAIDPYSKQ
ncbi:ABC transporter permease [Sansalvadorimonas sp. 2012CJ34-2]|uniref:ABC transporter permease n=1 Tax=Parendozoicomonas callyspongiae TaxID=2942213 RepID=A0ABT0PJ52_9GAMM|nr:ABC transporter permease [Sansalvadorimonas sp. 2012CJ34-2]MCL6270508.1 ABC transporter permease [Sansalvadorimonas sp. 2012CJ34-2]